ncbi:uncharacterized protein J4E78_007761 [Alternaria triticimaculans]|uniref:uncharacterized protein n=1 Tax=Alternaria triticimaculans TaxID=297637 RepID=UPI0020C2564C|nr:uncharacterized protein J4E78_007761 [Alternaria triticimaculans]KAI4652933.1 hypothetical protein J4E78_007761 [Alternaria triticimaculans]
MSSRGLPDVLMQKVDDYVDSLAPQIQPRIASELEVFQQKTIDSLETQVVDAFRSLFGKDRPSSSDGSRSGPWNLNDAAPDAYGGQSLPFADEIAKLTRSFGQISDEAGGDLRDIFDLTEGNRGGPEQSRSVDGDFSSGARGFLSSALNVVQDHFDERGSKGGQSFEIGGLLGMISSTIKDASQNPEEKARLISPEIKQTVGDKLRQQHAPLAEQFTRIALEHIKRWLRGNTSTRDLGDGAKAEIAEQVGDLVKGLGNLFGSKKSSNEETSRGFDDSGRDGESSSGGGFSRVISDKLSTGLAKVHREVRLEFRKILGAIEKQLFELLPDQFQRPLEKILGGNPFDSQLDRDASGPADRGFGDDIKSKLLSKIRALVQKVQETLRESILGVVNGGHRKFERQSWVFVQGMVEQKVQRYLPDVKINVPDDIGNENVTNLRHNRHTVTIVRPPRLAVTVDRNMCRRDTTTPHSTRAMINTERSLDASTKITRRHNTHRLKTIDPSITGHVMKAMLLSNINHLNITALNHIHLRTTDLSTMPHPHRVTIKDLQTIVRSSTHHHNKATLNKSILSVTTAVTGIGGRTIKRVA